MATKTPHHRAKQFPNSGLKAEKGRLFCGFCLVNVDYTIKSTIVTHINQSTGREQPPLPLAINRQISIKKEWSTMASVFVSTGIPLNVFRNSKFRDWMRDHLKNGETMPSESTLRRSLVEEGKDDLRETESICTGKDVIVIVDETQDIKNRKTINFLIAPAEPNSYFRLVNVEIVSKCDAPAIIQFIIRSLALVHVPITSIVAFVSDNAAYMMAAGRTLLLMNPKCIHSTCWAHVVHLVAEDIRASLELADELISKVKACLIKANSRRENLLNALESNGKARKLPPIPVLTRWTTWLETGNYHYTNFKEIRDWVLSAASDSKAMNKLKILIENVNLQKELETICLVYPSLSSAIKTLEKNNQPASDVYFLIETLRGILELSPALESGVEKLELYLNGKHPCIGFWKEVEFFDPRKYYKFNGSTELPLSIKILEKAVVPLLELVQYKNVCTGFVADANFCPFKFWMCQSREMPSLSQLALRLLSIPATSAEVERSFSMLNKLLTPSRSSLTEENLDIHLRLKYNNRENIVRALEEEKIEESEEKNE